MTYFAITFFVFLIYAALFYLFHSVLEQKDADIKKLWEFVHDLENDKRALMESLARAEGRPFIPPKRTEPPIPGKTWYSAPVEIIVKPQD